MTIVREFESIYSMIKFDLITAAKNLEGSIKRDNKLVDINEIYARLKLYVTHKMMEECTNWTILKYKIQMKPDDQ
jgi:hypothetical protein